MAKNFICHIEIASNDAKKSAKMYEELFGWKMNYDMGEDYILFQPESGPGGGIAQNQEVTRGDCVIAYIQVDDVNSYLKKAVELGCTEIRDKTEIPGHGSFALFGDFDGNTIGLFEEKK